MTFSGMHAMHRMFRESPDTIIDGTNGNKKKFWPNYGKDCAGNWRMNVDNYYALRESVGTQGLITVNYAYARYGRTEDPVARAAKLAADWVRYDKGRTKFWEIGNETGGPWESGWQIDPSKNKDGQPEIVSGELYGRHFRIFADSMRKAAQETGLNYTSERRSFIMTGQAAGIRSTANGTKVYSRK